MKKRWLTLAVTGAVALSLLGVSVLAADEGTGVTPETSVQDTENQTGEELPEPEEESAASQAGEPSADSQEEGEAEQPAEYIPDQVGTITFQNLSRRLRENNLMLLSLEENIQAIQVIDYDKMYDNIRKQLNGIADLQWMLVITGQSNSYEAGALEQSYDALRETFDAIKEGELQKDNADAVWQLRNAQDQLVMAGESLYAAIVEMERSLQTLDRNLAALDRSLEELDLRYQLGQISSQTVEQTRATRTALVSSRETLVSNLKNYKMQLELMSGGELNGTVQLGALPQVTDEQLETMNLEEDMAIAKQASYSLYEAGQKLEDAQESYKEQASDYNYNEKKYEFQMAKHQWQAEQYNHAAAVQNFEISFRTLYLQVKDFKQVLDAAGTALAVEEDNYATAQLKAEQGSLSANKLLEAEDKLEEAKAKVAGAKDDLFTAYNNYRWAVDYGILN